MTDLVRGEYTCLVFFLNCAGIFFWIAFEPHSSQRHQQNPSLSTRASDDWNSLLYERKIFPRFCLRCFGECSVFLTLNGLNKRIKLLFSLQNHASTRHELDPTSRPRKKRISDNLPSELSLRHQFLTLYPHLRGVRFALLRASCSNHA